METVKLKSIRQFFNKVRNFFKMGKSGLQQQTNQFNQFTTSGKRILLQIVEGFNELDVPSTALCQLVDDGEKVLIKLNGVWALVGIIDASSKYGALIIYAANRWSMKWEDYTIPINDDIRFDHLGNVIIKDKVLMEPENYGYEILNHILKVGRASR